MNDGFTTSTSPPQEAQLAAESARLIREYVDTLPEAITLTSRQMPGVNITISPNILRLWTIVMEQLGKGYAISITPQECELSTQQAADILNVSRPFLIKLLDEGKIAHHKVGSHRRVLLGEILKYRTTMQRERREILQELTVLGQEIEVQTQE